MYEKFHNQKFNNSILHNILEDEVTVKILV